MRIEQEIKLDYKDVLFRPKRSILSSRKEIDLFRSFPFKWSGTEWSGIPIVAANMDSTGTFEMANALSKSSLLTCLHKHYNNHDILDFFKRTKNYNFATISSGISEEELNNLSVILSLDTNIKFICLDVANGYSERFVRFVGKVRDKYPKLIIIAGNVVTAEMTEELILKGADIVKVGIGGGSVCTTRIQTGVGFPQLSAAIECADAAHGVGGYIMSDGGCTSSGDVAKAFGAGADFVMLGGMFAGHEESGGEITEENGEKYKTLYGMSSETAMNKYNGGVAEYRTSEGKTIKVKYKGAVEETVKSILGGIRSTCTYIGAKKIKDMPKCATFIRVTQQSNEIFGKNS